MYDIILINTSVEEYKKFKIKFPIAKLANSFSHAKKISMTEFFWVVWNDCDVVDSFDFSYIPDNWSKDYIHVFKNGDFYDGIALIPKNTTVTDKEVNHRFFVNKKEVDILASVPKQYDLFFVDSYEDYLYALENSKTEMFWVSSNNIKHNDELIKSFYISHHDTSLRNQTHVFIHNVDGKILYNGLFLSSKTRPLTQKEIDFRFPVNRIEHTVEGSTKTNYDIFTIDSYDEYLYALENSKTEMFWATSSNIDTSNFEFDLYFTHDNEYDRKTNHVFIHKIENIDYKNGVFLLSKHTPVTKKEIEHRFVVNAKEWPIIASGPVKYNCFSVDSYDDYLYALENSKTEMFWAISEKIKIADDFSFDLYFTHDNEFDRKTNHVFIHEVKGKKTYDGVFLFSKHTPVTKKEIEHRHIVHRKEWPQIASTHIPYEIFEIDDYDEYLYAFKNSKTEMFWMSSKNISIDPDFKFDLYYDYRDDEFITERKTTHAFIHKVNNTDLYNGLFLVSKHTPLSEKEVIHRFPVNRKEMPIVASGPVKYNCFSVDSYNDYLYALKNSKTEMFWAISEKIKIADEFNFDLYFTHDNEFDRKTNHVFVHEVKGKKTYDGVFLFSKHTPVTKKEIEHRHIVYRKEWPDIASTHIPYEIFEIDSFDDYKTAFKKSKTEMFWMSSKNISIDPDFKFDLYYDYRDDEFITERKTTHAFIHKVGNNKLYNGLFLVSKHTPLSEKEVIHRFPVNRKEMPIVASGPVQYDVFTVDSYGDYLYALENSKTEMFWATSSNIDTSNFEFDLYFTHDNEYDRKTNHAFVHEVNKQKFYNGLFLLSKHTPVTKKEIEHRFVVNAKEWPIIASGPVKYDIFTIENYDDYLYAFENSKTEMFWATSNNINTDNFEFDLYFTHDNEYDRKTNHAFIHLVEDKKLYNGVFLLSKHVPVTKKEIDHRFIVNAKEWPIIASGPVKYDLFEIDSYDDYLYALENSKTEMFWMSSKNITTSIPDIYFTHDNEYDRKTNHAFIHKANGKELYNGVFLLSKHKKITEKEIDHRFIVNAKEWPIIASGPVKYEIFNINTYDEYLAALKNSRTEMFWIIPNYVNATSKFKFDTYFTHDETFERKINHAYLNGKYHDGIVLCSKYSKFSKREFNYRFISHKKEVNIVISTPKPYDIVFISYQEPEADHYYKLLKDRFKTVKRVHGVKGIHQAHIEAAKLCSTDMFWIVDGDALIDSKFKFNYQVARWDRETVHVWRSVNPINDLVYGYGGVKLFPTELTLNMDTSKPDMTTSISSKFKAVQEISNVTGFNTDPFNTWKSAFRECAKLSSKVIDRQKDDETQNRLQIWCTKGADRPFGSYALSGAKAGALYGARNKNSIDKLKMINDFDWLKEQFNATNT